MESRPDRAECLLVVDDEPQTDVKYNVVVRGDTAQSTVQVRAFYRSERGPFGCISRGVFEQETEAVIKNLAGAERRRPVRASDRLLIRL